MTTSAHTNLLSIADTDWDDLTAVSATADRLLEPLAADPALLGRLARAAVADPDLFGLCEHYDILDKLVLHNDPTGWRLRLHVFLPGYFDRPHNHRWTYASRILTGHYTHTLYGTEDQYDGPGDEIDPANLTPRMTRVEEPGDTYTLHHSMIHSVTAAPHTTTLILRGPAVKDRFVVSDRVTGRSWWQHGAVHETPSQAAAKRMTPHHATTLLHHLTDHGVISP